MIGWWIVVAAQTPEELDGAAADDRQAARVPYQEHVRFEAGEAMPSVAQGVSAPSSS